MRASVISFALLVFAATSSSLAQWVQTGGPEGGYVNSLAEDDSFVYAGTQGYLYRMQKGDSSWTQLPTIRSWVIGAISLESLGSTLVAGTAGGGVFSSTDHGITWKRFNSGLEGAGSVSSFAVEGNNLFAGTNRGVHLSTDSGNNWSPLNNGQDSLSVLSLLIKDSTFIAGTWGGGVYRSTNRGTSWSAVNNGMTSNVVWSLAALDTAIFAGTWWADGIYRSADGGMTWKPVKSAVWSPDVNAFAVLGTTLLAGTFGGVFCSTNGGNSFSLLSKQPDGIVNCFHVSGTDVYAGTFNGVCSSSNAGGSWKSVCAGMISTAVNCILRDGQAIFAGTENDGLFRSTDDGASWVNMPLYSAIVSSLALSGTYYFAGTGHGIYRSTDGGNHWSQASTGMVSQRIAGIAMIPEAGGGNRLFAGTEKSGVFLSTNNGTNWTRVNAGLVDSAIRCLAVSGTTIFAGTGTGVFASKDSGASWSPGNLGLTDSTIQCLAAAGGYLYAGTDDHGVFRSSDNGSSWERVTAGMTDLNVFSLAASGTHIFAGTRSGSLFSSENEGVTWVDVDTGLVSSSILSLHLTVTDLFAGIRGGGVWRRPLSEMITAVHSASADLPSAYRLMQNYPNPFNPTTTIPFSLVDPQFTSLRVYDVLGREVAVLVDERRDVGVYEVKFDASGLSSGVYFYRLQVRPLNSAVGRGSKSGAGPFVQTRRLSLVK